MRRNKQELQKERIIRVIFNKKKTCTLKKKIARRNVSNLRYADDTTLTEESDEELKSLLMRMKEESEKAGLK